MLELAELIWHKINGETPFRYVSDDPSSTTWRGVCRPRTRRSGFSGSRRRPPGRMLDEVIPWITQAVADGTI